MGVLRTDLKRIFTSWIFYLSVFIVIIGGGRSMPPNIS